MTQSDESDIPTEGEAHVLDAGDVQIGIVPPNEVPPGFVVLRFPSVVTRDGKPAVWALNQLEAMEWCEEVLHYARSLAS
jgi:hypothetical protein